MIAGAHEMRAGHARDGILCQVHRRAPWTLDRRAQHMRAR
jgi:hypothetical protein